MLTTRKQDILRRITFPIPAPTRVRAPRGGAGPRLQVTYLQRSKPESSQRSARDARGGTGPSRSRAISPSVSLALWQGITSPSRSRAVSPSISPTPWQGIASPSLLAAKSQASRRESPALSQQARYFSRQPEFHESLDLCEQSVYDEDTTSCLVSSLSVALSLQLTICQASLEGKFDNLSSDVHEMKDILLHSISVQSQQKSLPPLRFKDPPARV